MGLSDRQILGVAVAILRGQERHRAYLAREEAREEYEERQRRREESDKAWEERLSAWEESRVEKECLILEAQKLVGAVLAPGFTDWKEAAAQQADIMRLWKEAGSAGRDNEDHLWRRFRAQMDEFFAVRSASRDNAALEKEALVSEAISVNDLIRQPAFRDWKRTNDTQAQLMDRWRKLGSAGRERDDALWKRFREARDAYFEFRKARISSGGKPGLAKGKTSVAT